MLTPRARVVLDTLLPSNAHPDLPLGIFDAGFEHTYGELLRDGFNLMAIGFHAALACSIWISPALIGKLPPIDRLSRDDRERALEAMAKSRSYLLRQMMLLLKATAGLAYGAHPEVRDAVGYPRQFDDPRGSEV